MESSPFNLQRGRSMKNEGQLVDEVSFVVNYVTSRLIYQDLTKKEDRDETEITRNLSIQPGLLQWPPICSHASPKTIIVRITYNMSPG